MNTMQERNARANQLRREAATLWQIVSPYRQSEYIAFRLRGLSAEVAAERTKAGPVQKRNQAK